MKNGILKIALIIGLLGWGFLPAWADEVDDMIAELKNSEEDVREEAAERLGQLGDPRAVPPLIQALRDSEDDVVEKAAESLGQLGDADAVEPLMDAFNSHQMDWGIRVKTAKAMEMIGDPRALPTLQAALADEQNPFVMSHLRRAIRSLEDRQQRENPKEAAEE